MTSWDEIERSDKSARRWATAWVLLVFFFGWAAIGFFAIGIAKTYL